MFAAPCREASRSDGVIEHRRSDSQLLQSRRTEAIMHGKLAPRNLTCLLGLALVSTFLAGCQNGLQQNLQPPGTIWQQRNRAVQFDPYPIDHMGPAIVGGRPREFGRPLPEAYDNQLYPNR
jgi:hypothetical protein